MEFEFATAAKIVFGAGKVRELGKIALSFGSKAVLVHGAGTARADPCMEGLSRAGITVLPVTLEREPRFSWLREALDTARAFGPELVIGIGGGSSLDGAKALSILLSNPGDPLDYAEVIGAGRAFEHPALPCIAIPTTAGTGSEVTRNAVVASEDVPVKISLRDASMLPAVALVDPALCLSLPPSLTATTGLDALTQLIEAYVSNRSNPLTDALCREGIARCLHCLPRAYADGSDLEAREGQCLASLLSGLALANARLGAVHGFAAPIGAMFHAPHGAVCAALLPAVVKANIQALRAREPGHPSLARYAEITSWFGLAGYASAEPFPFENCSMALRQFCGLFDVGGLASLGVRPTDFPAIAEAAARASSMQGNPVVLREDECLTLLSEACHSASG